MNLQVVDIDWTPIGPDVKKYLDPDVQKYLDQV